MIPRTMPLTKPQLAAMPFDALAINEREANDMVEGFYEEISLALESGESVNLPSRRTRSRPARY